MKFLKSISLLTLTFIVSQLFSQDNRDIRLGVHFSPSMNWVKAKTSNIESNGMGIGYTFGFIFDKSFGENYYFSTGLNIITTSNKAKLKTEDTGSFHLPSPNNIGNYTNVEYKYMLRYLEIPLMFKFRTEENSGLRFYFNGGVAPSFLIQNYANISAKNNAGANVHPLKDKYIPNSSESDKGDFTEFEDNVSFLRASMLLGAGAEYRLQKNTSIFGGIKFNNGLTDMLSDSKRKASNNYIALEIGLFF